MKRQQETLFREQALDQMKRQQEARDQEELLARGLKNHMHINDVEKHLGEAGNKSKQPQGKANKGNTATLDAGTSSKKKTATAEGAQANKWGLYGQLVSNSTATKQTNTYKSMQLAEGSTREQIDTFRDEAEETHDLEATRKLLEELCQKLVSRRA